LVRAGRRGAGEQKSSKRKGEKEKNVPKSSGYNFSLRAKRINCLRESVGNSEFSFDVLQTGLEKEGRREEEGRGGKRGEREEEGRGGR
jgi:hypothetical protein